MPEGEFFPHGLSEISLRNNCDVFVGHRQKAFEQNIVGRLMSIGETTYLITDVHSETGFVTGTNRHDGQVRNILFSVPEALFWLTKNTLAREEIELEEFGL